jgi:hypothetical protein
LNWLPLLLILPSILFPLPLMFLWLGGQRWRQRVGRPLARGLAVLAGVYASLAALVWVSSLGTAMRSLGNFTASFAGALFAVLHAVILLTTWRAARRGTASPLAVVAALPVSFVGLMIGAGAATSVARSRPSTNESATIGEIRSFLAAESGYASRNGEFFDVPDCLAQVEECLQAIPKGSHSYLSKENLAEVKHGYRRTFHPGPPAPPAEIQRLKSSRTSLTAFAYVAVPTERGRTGFRAFCGDGARAQDSGEVKASDLRVCVRMDGTMPAPIGGRCPADCDPLL